MSIHLTFENLQFSVNEKGEPKEILKGISGEVKPGEMLVIMGPSGCGKTTFLNILSGNLQPTSGKVSFNGSVITSDLQHEIAYVKQSEVINPLLSTRENLEYAAHFRIPEKDRKTRVKRIIDEFRLNECQNTMVGSSIKSEYGVNPPGISGGERRRAYIAQEILTNPSLIFFDEPTTGLDSPAALSVLTVIRALAKQSGCTVILTLHQPSSKMFDLFDKFGLMISGKMVYFGDAKAALPYFANLNLACPQYYNPADHFAEKLVEKESADILIEHFSVNSKAEAKVIDAEPGVKLELISEESSKQKESINHVKINPAERYTLPLWDQFTTLTRRSFIFTWRSFNPASLVVTFLIAFFIGLCGIRRQHLDLNDWRIPILNAVIFLGFIYGVGFMPTINAINICMREIPLVHKELKNGSYHPLVYFFAKRIGETPLDLFPPLVYVLIVYFMVGLRLDQYMLAHIAVMMVSASIASTLGVVYSGITQNNQAAVLLQTFYAIISLLTQGYYIPIIKLPVWMRWFQWIQFYRFGFEALLRIEYTGRAVHHVANSGFLSAENLAKLGNSTTYGNEILFDQLGIKLSIAQNFGALMGYWGLSHLLSLVVVIFVIARVK